MTFEQPAELDRLVTEEVPFTWRWRWQRYRVFVPVFAYIAINWIEMVGIALWASGHFTVARFILFCLPLAVGFPAFLLLVLELVARFSRRTKRVLNIGEAGISFYGRGRPVISWEKVTGFWFEEIPGVERYGKLTAEYRGVRKRRTPLRCVYVLEKATQQPQLLAELARLRAAVPADFLIEAKPYEPMYQPGRHAVAGIWLSLSGLILMMHGMPMLLVAALPHSGQKDPDSRFYWAPERREALGRFVTEHFSSRAELQHFMVTAGGIITLIAAGLTVWGSVLSRPRRNRVR